MEVHPEIYRSLEVLSKQLTFDKVGAQRVPDFLFEEEDFLPLLQSTPVTSCLQKGAQDAQSLLLLVRALLSR
jgi:hypothetical protein